MFCFEPCFKKSGQSPAPLLPSFVFRWLESKTLKDKTFSCLQLDVRSMISWGVVQRGGLDSREFNRIALRADNRCCLRNFPKNDDYGMDGKNIVAAAASRCGVSSAIQNHFYVH